MKEFKGTKTPWKIDCESKTCNYDCVTKDMAYAIIIDDEFEYDVAAVWKDCEGNPEANAKLIAAAPELLEALQELKNRFELIDNSELWKEDHNAIFKARKAINKALK